MPGSVHPVPILHPGIDVRYSYGTRITLHPPQPHFPSLPAQSAPPRPYPPPSRGRYRVSDCSPPPAVLRYVPLYCVSGALNVLVLLYGVFLVPESRSSEDLASAAAATGSVRMEGQELGVGDRSWGSW